MMKPFSRATVMGLTLGVLLAGYAVFAFTPPTQVPPGGNTPAPLNTGTSDQTKTGGLLNVFGLWVNQSLGVSGGASFGGTLNLQGNRITNVGSPSLTGDVATKGYADSATSNLQTRVSGSCPVGQGVRAIATDGSVTCQTIPPPYTPGQQSFTSSDTFTVPYVTGVKVTLVGGGGGGGGGASGHNVGFSNPGAKGGDGGTSSFGAYVIADGGQGGNGGSGSGGGAGGASGGSGGSSGSSGGSAGYNVGGIGGDGGGNIYGSIGGKGGLECGAQGGGGTGYGAGSGGGNGGCGGATTGGGGGGGGGSGAVIKDFLVSNLTPGADIPVTVGGAGSGGNGGGDTSGLGYNRGSAGAGGVSGYALISW